MRSSLANLIILALSLVGIAYVAKTIINQHYTSSATLYAEWKYRMPIYITSVKNYTDVQLKVVVNTGSLILDGKMKGDCSDIRFSYVNPNSGEEIPIPYWIESGCDTANTVIWIRIPYLPANKTVKVYMYYGNPLATSISNPNKVFDFYEDFSTNPNTNNKWVFYRATNDTLNECYWDSTNGVFYLTTATSGKGCAAYMKNPVTGDYVKLTRGFEITFKYKIGGGKGTGADGMAFFFDRPFVGSANTGESLGLTSNDGYAIEFDGYQNTGDPSADHLALIRLNVTAPYYHIVSYDTIVVEDNTWHTARIVVDQNGNVKVYIDGTLYITYNNLSSLGFGFAGFGAGTGILTNNHIIDDIVVRKYIDVPPKIVFGSEEYRPDMTEKFTSKISIESKYAYEKGEIATILAKYNDVIDADYMQIMVMNKNGSVIIPLTNMTRIQPNLYVYDLDTSNLDPGIYIIKVVAHIGNVNLTQVSTIKVQTTKQDILNYLSNVIYPMLIKLENMLRDIQYNQSISYLELLRIHEQANKTYALLKNVESNITSMNESVMNTLYTLKDLNLKILDNTALIIDAINRIINVDLVEIKQNMSDIKMLLSDIKSDVLNNYQYMSSTLMPKLDEIERRVIEVNDSVKAVELSLNEHDIKIVDMLNSLRNNVSSIMNEIEYVESLLRCDEIPNQSICYKLNELKSMLNSTQSKVNEIYDVVTDTNRYVTQVLTNKVDEILLKANEILNKEVTTYNELVSVHNDVLRNMQKIENLTEIVKEINKSLYYQLEMQMKKLIEINDSVSKILLEIRKVVVPKINQVLDNLTIVRNNTKELLIRTDCINIEKGTVCYYLREIDNETKDIYDTLNITKKKVENLQTIPGDLSVLSIKVTKVQNMLSELKDTISEDLKPKVTLIYNIYAHNVTPQVKEISTILANQTAKKETIVRGIKNVIPVNLQNVNTKTATAAAGLLGLLLLLAILA